ncbi:MAG: TonB-dependent receptor [Luminiphilus sp.]|nr:TonB-dependent receptor [Luminiphilus sp.]
MKARKFRTALTTLSALAAAGYYPTISAQNDQLVLEEVFVTAERREGSLQDVPLAVSAFDASEIERRQSFNVKDIVNNVPNLVGVNNVGQGTATTVFLRGVGTTESIVTVDTAMGFYLDDVYIARQGVNNFSLYDVERVEVLRGPQGTLYGRNTNAGAIKVVTTKPQDENVLAGEFSYGEFDRINVKGMANVVLMDDTLFLRVNALSQTGDGYVDNALLGKDVNDVDFWGWRAGLRWLPSEDVEVIITADDSTSDQNGVYALNVLNGIPDDLFQSSSRTDISNESETDGIAMTVNWDLSPNLSFQSITSSRTTLQKWELDLSDGNIFDLFTINDSDQLSQEFKVSGSAFNDRLQYSAGVFYFDEDSYSFIGDRFFLGSLLAREYNVDVESIAAYFDGTFDVTDKLSIVLGGRYTRDEKSIDIEAAVGVPPGFSLTGGSPTWNSATLNALGTPTELDFNDFTPKIGLKYAFNDDLDGYVTFTEGYRAGGWAARTNDPTQVLPFEPEVIDSLAVGLKASLLDGRARLNSEYFYYDYQDLFNSATDPDTGNFAVFTNDAKVQGLEIEGTMRISENLDIFGFVAFSDGEYKDVDPAVGASLGSKLQRLPESSFKLGFTNIWPMAGGSQVRLNADYQYTEDHFTDPPNTDLGRSGDIGLLSASLGWESADSRFSVALSCRNCSDEEYNTATLAFAPFGFVSIYPGEPRTWLITLKARTN